MNHNENCPLFLQLNGRWNSTAEARCTCTDPLGNLRYVTRHDSPKTNLQQLIEREAEEFEKEFRHSKFCREAKVGTPCNCDYEDFKSFLTSSLTRVAEEHAREVVEEIVKKMKSEINSELVYAGETPADSGEMGARNVVLKRLKHNLITSAKKKFGIEITN